MKSSSKIYWQWFGIGVLITFICVGAALFITHQIAESERSNERRFRELQKRSRQYLPHLHRVQVIRDLTRGGKYTVDEAYEIVDKVTETPFAEASFLLNKKQEILSTHKSKTYDERMKYEVQEFQLSDDRFLRVHMTAGPHGRPHRPPGALFIIILVLGVAISVGIGLSIIGLTMYMRKKARNIEAVMNQLKSGDLKARFHINQMDEAGELMLKFNEMAEEIEKLVTNLRETEESRKLLLQELAHDLRTPVASMKNFQETLFDNGHLLTTERRTQLQAMAMKEVVYFERLVEDLLFLSGVNDPRYGKLKNIELSFLVEEELGVFDNDQVKMQVQFDSKSFIKGDEHLIHRLLKNAFSNATRYAQTKVEVSVKTIGTDVIFLIRDDGPGFSESDLSIFGEKKFTRKYPSDQHSHISIGLGAVIMKKIMSLHNGALEIRNWENGAELLLRFPQSFPHE